MASIAGSPNSGCAPLAVAFNGMASGPGPFTWSWTFPGGIPATSTQPNVAVLYNTPGLHTATLIASNANGNSTPATYNINVNPIPAADFTEDKTTGCYPTWVNFTNLTNPAPGEVITSYLWNFGDGSQSNLPSPSHRYTTGGNINVTLYVTNNFGCTGSAQVKNVQKAITLNGGGIFPNFNSSLNTSCNLPVIANFNNTTVGPNVKSALWDFGDGGGFTSNIYSPTHTYTTAGTYSVRLAASSTQGCSDTLNLPINITASGNLTDFTVQDTNCVNTQVNFTNISSPNPNLSVWNYGDGAPPDTTKNGQHLYTVPGKYTVTLTNTFAGCNGTISKDIYIVNPPVASFTGTNLNSCKAPLTATFTNTSTGATTWSWDFGDGTKSNLQNPPPHTYNALGSFQVTLNASSAGGCSSNAVPVTVNIQQPTVTLDNPQLYFGCAPYTLTPTATITAVDGVASYSWNFGNGNTSNAVSAPPQTYGAGTWTITLTITTTGGCTASTSATLLVGSTKPTPVSFNFVPPSACVASPVQFTATPGTANKWFWDYGDGNTDNTNKPNPAYSYLKPGTYTVKLTEYLNGCWDTVSQNIVVNPPLADFKISTVCGAHNRFVFTDNSTGPVTTYLWDFGDGTTSASPGPITHNYPVGPPKLYNVTLTATTGACSNTSPPQTVNANQGQVIVYTKNPVCANSITNIAAITDPKVVNYTFKLSDGTVIISGSAASFNYSFNTPGTYQVKVITTDNTGCVDSSGFYSINVYGPTPNFTAPPALSCGALTYNFKDLSTPSPAGNNIVNWLWDFGDGSTSNAQSPTHTYAIPGTFTPNLTVTDNFGCSATLDSPVSITVSIPVAAFTVSEDSSCPNAPNPIRFTNNSSGGFNPVYTWKFGNGDTSNAIAPIYAYTAVGNFNASLSMTDAYGCTSNSPVKLIVVDTPHADFTMSGNYSACPPFNVNFTFTGHYALTYNWDFTDGNGSVIKNPSNLFVNPGDYYPNLTVTSHGGCVSQSDSQHVKIDGPVGTFNYSPLAGCDSLDVNFTVTTTNVVSFTWNFGDGNTFTGTNPSITHHYNIPGQFPPSVTLVDIAGCKVAKIGANMINVDAITQTLFTADKSVVCDSGTVKFTNTSVTGPNTSITNYSWDFGDGSPVQNGMFPTIAHNYTAVGNYTATMSITSFGGCTGSYNIPITVAGSPKVAVNGLLNQCEPAVMTFFGVETVPDPNQPLTWSWDFGNLQTSTLQNPAPVSYPKAGQYKVQLIATNTKGCSDTTDKGIPFNLFIYPIPTVNAGADTTICDTSSLQLLASGSVSTTYNWLAPTPPASLTCLNCNNPVASSPSSTFFVLNGTSPQGCAAKDTINVTVNTQVTVSATGTDSVCLGQSAPLNATGASIYNWTPAQGLNNPNIANPVATPDASQIGGAPSSVITYTVTGYDNKKCYSDTKSIDITAFNYPVIGLAPNATINVGSSYQINSTVTTNVVSLTWTPSNTLSCANCLTPLATPTKTTKYVLTAVNDGGCATSDSIRVQVICDGTNFFVPNTFSPNGDGINDNFVVNGVGLNVIPSITIYNRWGQIVFQKSNFAPNVPSEGWDGTFNGKPAPPDVYIYTIQILCNNATLIPYHGNVTLIR